MGKNTYNDRAKRPPAFLKKLILVRQDFYSMNWTFTGFTDGPTDFCSSSIPYDIYTIFTRLSSLVEWSSFAVVYTVSYGLVRSHTVLYNG